MFTHKTSRDDRLRRGEHRHVSLHHVLQEQKERSSASSSPGFPCIWIKTLHISPRCKDIVITLAHKQIMFIQICICIYREREKFSRVRVILCIYIYICIKEKEWQRGRGCYFVRVSFDVVDSEGRWLSRHLFSKEKRSNWWFGWILFTKQGRNASDRGMNLFKLIGSWTERRTYRWSNDTFFLFFGSIDFDVFLSRFTLSAWIDHRFEFLCLPF